MKQGRVSRDVREVKAQPIPRGVSPGGADQLGQKLGKRQAIDPLYKGPAFQGPTPSKQIAGPGGGRTVYQGGSQGKH